MVLSSSLVLRHLSELYTIVSYSDPKKADCLTHTRFLSLKESFLPHTIYLTDTRDILQSISGFPSTSLLFYIGVLPAHFDTSVCNMCVFPPTTDIRSLFNHVVGIFESHQKFEASLGDIIRQHGTLQDLLDVALPTFENDLIVVNMEFDVLAMTQKDGCDYIHNFSSTEKDFDLMTALKQDELFNAMREVEHIFLFPGHVSGERTLCKNLKQHGFTKHRMILRESCQPFRDGDEALLLTLADYASQIIEIAPVTANGAQRPLHNIFLRIVSDKTADYVRLSTQLTAVGWKSKSQYLAIVLQITYLEQKTMTIHALCSYIEHKVEYSCALTYRNEIVIYINLELNTNEVDDIIAQLLTLARDSFLKMGISRVMTGHMNLRRQYLQAHIANDVGSRKSPYLWKHQFNDIAFSYILEQSTRSLPGYMLCHEKLLTLQELDASGNTDYLKTLQVYLEHRQNAVQTAKALFIHRSTLIYRLERIEEIMEIDFNNYKDMLYLMFSFEMIYPGREE